MNTQQHRMRGTWPLYLAIGIGGAASIATSPPPSWHVALQFEGPAVTLDPDQREDTIPFKIRFTPGQDWSEVSVMGAIEYQDAAEELHISLVDPDERPLATHVQAVEGDGRFLFQLDAPDVPLGCEPSGSDACEQDLAVVFDMGGARTGAYVIHWYLQLRTGGDGATPPDDLIFEAELEGGRAVDDIPPLLSLFLPPDAPGDGRWRLVGSTEAVFFVTPDQPAQPLHFVVRGAGPYTTSELFMPFSARHRDSSLADAGSFRITLVPDDPAAGAGAEYVVAVAGEGSLVDVLSIPEPLDCTGESVCERGFTIAVEAEDLEDLLLVVHPQAVLDGDGDSAPAGAFIELLVDPVYETAGRQDG